MLNRVQPHTLVDSDIYFNKFKEIFPDDAETIIILLKDYGAIISGSLILQIIYGKYYPDSDIDIIVNMNQTKLNTLRLVYWNKIDSTIDTKYNSLYSDNKIKSVYTSKNTIGIHNYKIQLIEVNDDPIRFLDNFDLNICKNWFDGKFFYSLYKNDVYDKKTKMNLNIHSDSDMGDNDKFYSITIERFVKYIKRGIYIEFDDEFGLYKKQLKRALYYNESFISESTLSNCEQIIDKLIDYDIELSDEPFEKNFICPISNQIMIHPVITPFGHSYDQKKIKQWLSKNTTDPITRKNLIIKQLYPNKTLKNTIDEYIKYRQTKKTAEMMENILT
jgi:hypothetical protein